MGKPSFVVIILSYGNHATNINTILTHPTRWIAWYGAVLHA